MSRTTVVLGEEEVTRNLLLLGWAGTLGLTRATTRIAFGVQKRARTKILKGPKTGHIYGADTDVMEHLVMQHLGNAKQKSKAAAKVHQASAPGEAPANDTGNLARSIIVVAAKESREPVAIVETNAPYAAPLEFGTRQMEPRPFLLPSLDEVRKSGEAQVILEDEFKKARGSVGK